ncbi:alanine racemase [Allohahella marinimesophila]|uniref:Alanine racemase n=1 Tax=Allohahella marinimesophila TaxID=1054972 RepID=A0ABP7PQJ7_9GAMM
MTRSSKTHHGSGRPLEAVIDVGALKRNFSLLNERGQGANCVAVVKSDGYGHGLQGVIEALPEVGQFAVATANELDRLDSELLSGRSILILEGFFDLYEPERIRQLGFCVEWVIHSHWQLELLESSPMQSTAGIRVWIKINTGMNRLGFPPTDVPQVFRRLAQLSTVIVLGIASHLACADTPEAGLNQQQFDCFAKCHAILVNSGYDNICEAGRLRRSLLNSAGLLQFPQYAFDQVRPGIALYGALDSTLHQTHGLSPVMTLQTRLVAVQQVWAGDRVGYGGDYVATEDHCVGIVAAGYGDGYPRQVSTRTESAGTEPYVLVKGQPCRLVGRCSMDMLTVDLGPTADCDYRAGDSVELWGKHLPVDLVAGWASTISYHLLTGVTRRVPRRYIDSLNPVNQGAKNC